ncbi:MAG: type IV pilus secretin PilQ, partial [bacterium]|nr:type IV pilus secretin PilQ [bacterium]
PVNYSTAESLLSQINGMLSPRGRVSVNERTNVLVVSDVKPKIEQIDQLVQSLDTQTPQILIEARLVEASTQFSRSLGVQWGGSFFGVKGGSPVGAAGPAGTSVPVAAGISNKNYAVNFPVENAPASIGFSMGSFGNMAVLNARLSAAENDGQAKTVSMPKIMTLDNKAARITQGFRVPYSVINSSVTQTQFIDAALELNVTPHATSDGSVRMSIKITQNSPDFDHPNPLGIPPIKIKEATTELLVKDGDTAVIGGIFTRSVSSGDNSVPGLSKIPILGWLFKSSNKSEDQSELLVFLTPRLMNRQMSTIDTSLKPAEAETKKK